MILRSFEKIVNGSHEIIFTKGISLANKGTQGNWRTSPATHKEIKKYAVDREMQLTDLAELCWRFYTAFKLLSQKQIDDIMHAAKVDPHFPGRVAHLAAAVLGHSRGDGVIADEPG